MKNFVLSLIVFFVTVGLFAHPDEPVPSDTPSYSWHTVILVDYKPGAEASAKELIKKFESACVAAGTSAAKMHWFNSGKYDLVVTWHLENSPSEDQWTWCPDSEDWWNALVKQEGSVEAAQQVQEEYKSLVASSVTSVARKAK